MLRKEAAAGEERRVEAVVAEHKGVGVGEVLQGEDAAAQHREADVERRNRLLQTHKLMMHLLILFPCPYVSPQLARSSLERIIPKNAS